MKTVGIKVPTTTVINENYVSDNVPPLKKTNSAKNMVALPEVKFPTKKFRMRSLLWVKPTGVAVSSTSSLLAQVCMTFFKWSKFAQNALLGLIKMSSYCDDIYLM